jgi:putative methionine-R-sulfoxide reductase with GAF domain
VSLKAGAGIIADAHRLERLCAETMDGAAGRYDRMRRMTDLLWGELSAHGLSWVGFYIANPDASESERLILGPRRDRPACSPIGLHGACGTAFLTGRPLVVEDVASLGAAYIACDPRDRSELVLPCFGDEAVAWGVLDLDSHEVGRFSNSDAECLADLLRVAGLSR